MLPKYGLHRFKRRPRVEIIPLIDIMFLLLAFFIYGTMHMVIQKGILVDLASSSTGSADMLPRTETILFVTHEGRYFVNDAQKSRAEVEDLMKSLGAASPNQPVFIHADKNASHGQVMDVLDMAKRYGITQAIFGVE